MRLNARSMCLLAVASLLLSLNLSTMPGLAQETPVPQPTPIAQEDAQQDHAQPAMTVELDINRLVFDGGVSNTQDPVWRLNPSPGKRIVFIPFTVNNVNQTNKLSRFPISVRQGRFIGFVIPKPELNNRAGDGVELNRIINAKSSELKALLFDVMVDDGVALQHSDSPEEEALEPTPENAPRLAREITLHPDGTVRWGMARSFQSAELNKASEQNLYAYKIDAQQLRDAQPEKAERLTRNDSEDAREFALRKREQQLAEREKVNVYRNLRDRLRELPESFSEPMPSVLYAALEIPDGDTISFEGPAPLPWSLDDAKKELFVQLSRGGARSLEDSEGRDLSGSLITMLQSHPLDARAIAIATMRSRLAGDVGDDDPGYKLMAKLLQSKDIHTRRIALLGTARVTPPTLASAKLIGVAGEAALGEERKMLGFASLGKLFSTQSSEPEDARVLIDRVSKTIADPQGPAAPQVIEQVLASLAPTQGNGRRQQADPVTDVMIEAIDFSGVDESEFAGVVAAIIQQAPTNPVAAGWLDQKLLGSSDQALISQTLSVLYESVLQPPAQTDPGVVDQAPAPLPLAVPVQNDDTLVLSSSIPMTRADHTLIGLLESSDDLQQAAAWSVLGKFHIALTPTGTDAGVDVAAVGVVDSQPKDPAMAMLDAILGKAKASENMPMSIVAFLANQKGASLTEYANDQLIVILSQPDLAQQTALAAIDVFTASPQRYISSIAGLEANQQHDVIKTMYRSENKDQALIFGMIADGGVTLKWFADYVAENQSLPAENDWVDHAQDLGESTLLQHASSKEDDLAIAAAMALVLISGGEADQALSFAQTVALMKSRQAELLREEWTKHRNKIYEAGFKRATGNYQLVAILGQGKERSPEGELEEEEPGQRIELGVVEFRAEGLELSLSVESVKLSPVNNRLGIRLDNPASLRSFSKTDLSKIAPQHLSQPIDLLPQEGGVWSGQANLPEGRTITVSLEPVN